MPRLADAGLITPFPYSVSPTGFPEVCNSLASTNAVCLRSLCLSGISAQSHLDALAILPKLAGTGTVTELRLTSFLHTPDFLKSLLRWPARLEKLAFEYEYAGRYGRFRPSMDETWGMSVLVDAISTHRKSLRCLSVANLPRQGIEYADLSTFTSLEFLSLSSGVTGQNYSEHLLAHLAAPGLKTFRWDLTNPYGQQSLYDFGEREENWLRMLVQVLTARQVPLRHLRLEFNPNTKICYTVMYERYFYPWDRLDDIARDVEPHGIVVSCNPPTITKRELWFNYHLYWLRTKEIEPWEYPIDPATMDAEDWDEAVDVVEWWRANQDDLDLDPYA
ncbi:hypothetical protein GQ53DRAFT_835591 [Thozetella sp. PMI_491]|nr:hypothetical protein GQ53DRAFT_835591 [Thozetella sp. PMI_491]